MCAAPVCVGELTGLFVYHLHLKRTYVTSGTAKCGGEKTPLSSTWVTPQSDCDACPIKGSNRAGVVLPLESNRVTLVHTLCDVQADDNWNCSSLHFKLLPRLFFSFSITPPALPCSYSPLPLSLPPPSPRPPPRPPCPFSSTESLFTRRFPPIVSLSSQSRMSVASEKNTKNRV